MLKKKLFVPLLCVLSTIVLIFSLNSSVFAHGKLINNDSSNSNSQETVAQNQPEEVEINLIPLRNNIYMLMGDGGNMGVAVGEEEVVIIDSQFATLTTKIQDAIAKVRQEQPIRYLINTHYHYDHVGGNANFAQAGATIIAHENVPKQMSVDHEYPAIGMKIKAAPPEALPKIFFSDQTNLKLDNQQINAFHLPLAHTDGDVVVHFPAQNVIHTGDLFFNGFYPFIDTTVGGSIDGTIKAIDQILPLCNDETLIIPGHGKLSNQKELIAFQEMLRSVSGRVKEAIAKDTPLEQMIADKLLDDLDETWGNGFLNAEQFLTIVYQGMVKS